jgi:hypothetical protein
MGESPEWGERLDKDVSMQLDESRETTEWAAQDSNL